MLTMRTAIVVAIGLIMALWWAVMPPRFTPAQAGPVGAARQLQCPEGSRLEGKLCVCPDNSAWNGVVCERGAKKLGIVSQNLGPARGADSSLAFARTKVPSLPGTLTSWPAKLDAINSAFPQAGSVAMIEVATGRGSEAGHVAIVEEVGDSWLTIIEGNYISGEVTRRTAAGKNLADAARQLRIVGYFQP
jgi:hypothetical protein